MSEVTDVTFESLNLNPEILQAIDDMGYVSPTDIQREAIELLTGTDKDFIGQAQTGTGKTAAFVIPLLQKIDPNQKHIQSLILSPTRELASQIDLEIKKIGKYMNVRSTCILGGTSYDTQIRALKRDNPQLVVGTPGRVLDLIKKGMIKLENTKLCVLDEADEMLNMGFFEDVQTILELFHEERQLIMFSATMPRSIVNLIDKSFNEYEMVKVKNKSLSNGNIEQKYFVVKPKYFTEALTRIIDSSDDFYCMVFCKTKIETAQVGEALQQKGHMVEVLNGDMSQAARNHAMKRFKDRRSSILVCTDVAARGIDVNNLTHVINYGLPQSDESYVHRIGRTGRAGMKGKAYTLVDGRAAFIMKKIERQINATIPKASLPLVTEIKKNIIKRDISTAESLITAVQGKGDDFKVDPSFASFAETFGDLSKDELLKLMFTWKYNKALRHYDNLPEIEDEESRGGSRRDTRRRGRGGSRGDSRRRDSRGGGRSDERRGRRTRSASGTREDRFSRDDRSRGNSRDDRSKGNSRDDRSRGNSRDGGGNRRNAFGRSDSYDRRDSSRGNRTRH